MDKSCHTFADNMEEPDGWILWEEYVSFYKKLQNCLVQSVAPFCRFPSNEPESCGSTSPSVFGVASVPDFGHSTRCGVVACCFNLHFPDGI